MDKIFTIFSLLVLFMSGKLSSCTPLDDYVWKDDGYFKYKVVNWSYTGPGVTSFLLNMTSQRWLTDDDVTRSVWQHDIIVNIPNSFDPALQNSGFLLIEGGHNPNDKPPSTTDDFFEAMALMASTTKSITAVLRQVPNQSVMFKKDPQKMSRTEDAIIAYTWRHFIEDPSKPEWLLRMPMTKAAVKAMDAVTDFVNKTTGKEITKYCVGGASKRGWTTWTTGAVDSKRVKCIVPIVLDVLNFVKNLHHHYRAYGGWSFALDDYYFENITRDLDQPNTQKMADIVDPYSYRDRLTMPKLIISMGGDEFFLPDDSHYYFGGMKGMNYVNMVPNDEHEFKGHDLQVFSNIRAFYVSVMTGYKLPQVIWTLTNSPDQSGAIEVALDTKPVRINAWVASTLSKTRRDFRMNILNQSDPSGGGIPQMVMWVPADVDVKTELTYSFSLKSPPQGGWSAFFIQMGFQGPNGTIFECTTETNIVPNTFPFDDCQGNGCLGTLL